MPCVAKHLLRFVLSTTPGKRFAEYTVKTSEKQAASTGALPVLTAVIGMALLPELGFAEDGEPGTPTLTKEKRSLIDLLVGWVGERRREETYLNVPPVRTDRSCRTNQMPILSSGSVNLNALAARLPIKFRVNIPCGAVLLTGMRGILGSAGV